MPLRGLSQSDWGVEGFSAKPRVAWSSQGEPAAVKEPGRTAHEIALAGAKSSSVQFTRRKLMEFVEGKGGEYTLEEIVAEFGNPAAPYSPDYLRILRTLIDDGTVPMYGY